MNEITNLISNKDWKSVVHLYGPKILAKKLPFKMGMTVAYQMLFNDEREDALCFYATELLQELRKVYAKEWSLDWKNDVFLGDACYMIMRHDERYEAYKRACEKANPPPSSLLISLASCYLSPKPHITLEEAEDLAKKALEKETSVEGVVLLRGIYAEKKDQANFEYWDTILRKVIKDKSPIQNLWPDFSDA